MKPALRVGAISFGALAIGFGVNALASFQFRTDHLPLRFFGPIIVVVALGSGGCDAVGPYRLVAYHLAGVGGGLRCGGGDKLLDGAGRSAGHLTAIWRCSMSRLAIPFALSAGILILDGNHACLPRPGNWADRGVAPRRSPGEARQRSQSFLMLEPLARRRPSRPARLSRIEAAGRRLGLNRALTAPPSVVRGPLRSVATGLE